MALDVIKLKEQIAKERESLKSVDDNIRKITGRDPNEIRDRQGNDTRRVSVGAPLRGRERGSSFRRSWNNDSKNIEKDLEPPRKRAAVFSRLGASVGGRRVAVSRTKIAEKEDDDDDEEDVGVKPAVQSSVVSTAKKISKDDLISAQNVGEKGKARNRRMFGMLLGTLAKFNADGQGRQSKQTLKQKEVETRLEEETEQERKKLASERKILFTERKQQQRRITLMEEKIALANELTEWEKEWEKKSNFIMTKATPNIFFLPTAFTPRTQRALQDSKDKIKGLVEKHRTSVAETMSAYDDEIKILENKQDNDNGTGNQVKNGEGMHASRGFKKGGRIDHEPEEEMDLDSMEHHVDIKVDVEDGDQNTGQVEEEHSEPTQSDSVGVENEKDEIEKLAQKFVPEELPSGMCKVSVDTSLINSTIEEADQHEKQDAGNAIQPSDEVVTEVEQSTKSDVLNALPQLESTAIEDANAATKPFSHDKDVKEECKEADRGQSVEQDRHSAADTTSSESADDKASDKEAKAEDSDEKLSPGQKYETVPPHDDAKVSGQQSDVAKQDKAPLSEDDTKKEVVKTADAPSRDNKSTGRSRRRRNSSSSDSTSSSSSSSSSDSAPKKTRSRRNSNNGRSRGRDSMDDSRSRRSRHDRSRNTDRRDRSRSRGRHDSSRSRDRSSRRDRRRR